MQWVYSLSFTCYLLFRSRDPIYSLKSVFMLYLLHVMGSGRKLKRKLESLTDLRYDFRVYFLLFLSAYIYCYYRLFCTFITIRC